HLWHPAAAQKHARASPVHGGGQFGALPRLCALHANGRGAGVNPANILIIKPSAIGDVVHALPVLSLVKRRWPAAKVSWLVTPACSGLLDGHPLLDEVILFDRKRLGHVWRSPRRALELRRFTRALRRRQF